MYSFPGGPPGGAPQANSHAPLGAIAPGTATGVAPNAAQDYGFRPAPLQHTGTFQYQQPPQQQYHYQQPPPPPPPSYPQPSPQQPYFHNQGPPPPPLPPTAPPQQQQYSWPPQPSQGGYNPAAPPPQFGPQANSGTGYNPNGAPIVHGQYVPPSMYGSHATGQPAPPPPHQQYQYQAPMPPPLSQTPQTPITAHQPPQPWNQPGYQQQPYQQQQQQHPPPPPPQKSYSPVQNHWNSNQLQQPQQPQQPQQFQPQQPQPPPPPPPPPQQQLQPLGDYYSMSQPPVPTTSGATTDNTQSQSPYQFGQSQQPTSPPPATQYGQQPHSTPTLGQATPFSAGGGYNHLGNPVSTSTPPQPAAPPNDYAYPQNAQVYNNESAKPTPPPQPQHLLSQQIYTFTTATPPLPPPNPFHESQQPHEPTQPPPVLPIAPATAPTYTYTPPAASQYQYEPPKSLTPPPVPQPPQPSQQYSSATAATPPPALQAQPQPPLKEYRWAPTPPPKPPTPKAPSPPKPAGSAWTSANVFASGGLTSWETYDGYYADGPGDEAESPVHKSPTNIHPAQHPEIYGDRKPVGATAEASPTPIPARVVEQKPADLSPSHPSADPSLTTPQPQMNVGYIISDVPPSSQEPAVNPQSQTWQPQSNTVHPLVESTTPSVMGDIPPSVQPGVPADSTPTAFTIDQIVVPALQQAEQPTHRNMEQSEEDATIERLQELDPFYQDSITRFIVMIEAEAAAPKDEEKLKIFKDFMEQEYFLRGQKYPLAIGDPPSRQGSLARLPVVAETQPSAVAPAVEFPPPTPFTAPVEVENPVCEHRSAHVESVISVPVVGCEPVQAVPIAYTPPVAAQNQALLATDHSQQETGCEGAAHVGTEPIDYPQQQQERYAAQKLEQHPPQSQEQYPEQQERYPVQRQEQYPQQPNEQYPAQVQQQHPPQPQEQYPEQQERYPVYNQEQYPQHQQEPYPQEQNGQYPAQVQQQQHPPPLQEQYPEQQERYPGYKQEQYPQQPEEQYPKPQEQYPAATPNKELTRQEFVEPPAALGYAPFRPSSVESRLPLHPQPLGTSESNPPKPNSPAPEPPKAGQPTYAPYKPGTITACSNQRRNSFSGAQAPVDSATADYTAFHRDAEVTPFGKTSTARPQSEYGPIRRAGTTVDMDLSTRPAPRVDETFLPMKESASDDFFPSFEESHEEPVPPAPAPIAPDTVTRDLTRLLPPKGTTRQKSRALEDTKLALTNISEDFSFIDKLTSDFDTKALANRKKFDEERRARQEEHQDYIDSLFAANKIGYGDIGDMDDEFNKKEEMLLKEEEKNAYDRYVTEVFEPVYNQLQEGIKNVMNLHFRTSREFLASSVAGRDRWNAAGRPERDAVLQTLVRLDGMAERRHARVHEAIVARDRRFRKTVTEPLKVVNDIKKMNTMIKHFDDSERKLTLASCREKQMRTRTLLSVIELAVDTGLEQDLNYITQLTMEINKILAALPGPPSAYTGNKAHLKGELLHAHATLKGSLQVAENLMKVAHVASLVLNAADHEVSLAEARIKGEDENALEDRYRMADEAVEAELEERVKGMMQEYGVVVGNLEMVLEGLGTTTAPTVAPLRVEKSRTPGPSSPGLMGPPHQPPPPQQQQQQMSPLERARLRSQGGGNVIPYE